MVKSQNESSPTTLNQIEILEWELYIWAYYLLYKVLCIIYIYNYILSFIKFQDLKIFLYYAKSIHNNILYARNSKFVLEENFIISNVFIFLLFFSFRKWFTFEVYQL